VVGADGLKRRLSAFFVALSFEIESERRVSSCGTVKWLWVSNILDIGSFTVFLMEFRASV